MARFFIALPVPEQFHPRLVRVQPTGAEGVRLVEPHHFHLTLHFLGDVRRPDLQRLINNLRVNLCGWPAIRSCGIGMGLFARRRGPGVLHLRLDLTEELRVLHSAISGAIRCCGGEMVEKQPFSPHITVARARTAAATALCRDHLERTSDVACFELRFPRIVLYSSQLTPLGPKYREVLVIPLVER